MRGVNRRNFLRGSGVAAVVAGGAGLPALAAPVPAGMVRLEQADVPVAAQVDVCVIGGSCTGVFAALRAAQAGMRVALVEKNGFFGGTATAAMVPVWHSLWSDDGAVQIIKGLTAEVIESLVARGEAQTNEKTHPTVYCYFNGAAMTLELDRRVRAEEGIRPFLHTRFAAAVSDRPGHVTHAIVEDKSGRRAIAAKFFIDASGDADLIERAGLTTWKLPLDQIQGHTTCALISGFNELRKETGFNFRKVMQPEYGANLPHTYLWSAPVIGVPSLHFLAMTRVLNCDPSDADDLTRGEMESRAQLNRYIDAANRAFPSRQGPGLRIAAIAPVMGVRESRHVKCLHSITSDELLRGKRFDDVIARGSYRIDIHEKGGITFMYLNGTATAVDGEGRRSTTRWLKEGETAAHWYEIPYRSIVPLGSENLLCAGRMLDCDRNAYGALRVMVNCNQMGEAAGRAAAHAIRNNLTARDAYPGLEG